MKIVKIKNPKELVARMNYTSKLDPVDINDIDACYTQDANGLLRPLSGFYKGCPIRFRFHEDHLIAV